MANDHSFVKQHMLEGIHLEWRYLDETQWRSVKEHAAHTDVEYRFRPDPERPRVYPVTSMRGAELLMISGRCTGYLDTLREVANEAIKRYIIEQEKKNGYVHNPR